MSADRIMSTAENKAKIELPAKRKVVKKVELDALFDYSRMTPTVVLEDSDDEDVHIIDNIEVKTRRSTARPLLDLQGNIERSAKKNVVKKMESEDDWLAPPTRITTRSTQPADPGILQLRRQKQELLSLSVQIAAESAELEAKERLLSSKFPSAVSDTVDLPEDVDIPNSREKIVLQLQEQGGKTHTVKIYIDDKFEKLFAIFAEKFAKRPVTDFTFRFDGTTLDPQKTPKEMELEDEDMIEVDVRSTHPKRRV